MDTLIETSDLLTNTVVVLGTVAWAVSGAMAAARHRLDWFGVVVLGVIVAVGGGTVRDLLLGLEVSWIQRPWPVFLAAGVALLTIPPARRWATAVDQWQIVLAADALGLGLFTVLGCDTALHAGTSSVVAVILGVMGGISGGVIRDLLLTRTPVVLTGEIYALAALAGAVTYVLLLRTSISPVAALWIPVLLTFGLRAIALRRAWAIPAARIDRDGDVDV
jgi:uncharacterized membrane protein YeiH